MIKPQSLYVLAFLCLCAGVPIRAQEIRYAPQWFGPNAHPVPRIQRAIIPSLPTVSTQVVSTLGGTDKTQSLYIDAELPLISEAVSFRIWGCLQEHYAVSPALALLRGMPDDAHSGWEGGDYYVQTRIRLLKERRGWIPGLILHSTLKTAAAKRVSTRRYFDTAGYFFHLEAGKNLLNHAVGYLDQIRLALSAGFMSWDAGASIQNDAPMYGLQLEATMQRWVLSTEISAYSGWMNNRAPWGRAYGDRPIVIRADVHYRHKALSFRLGYEQGIRDFPYRQALIGIQWQLPLDIAGALAAFIES